MYVLGVGVAGGVVARAKGKNDRRAYHILSGIGRPVA